MRRGLERGAEEGRKDLEMEEKNRTRKRGAEEARESCRRILQSCLVAYRD
jgi:hypothetical protein